MLLLCSGVDVDAVNKDGETVLFTAVRRGNYNVVQLLLQLYRADVNVANLGRETALLLALRGRNEQCAQLLLQHGADVKYVAAYWGVETALMVAVNMENDRFVEQLLEHRADVGVVNKIGNNTLIAAVRRGNDKVVQLLLQHGAHANAEDWNRETALLRAVENGNDKIVQLLLQHGADVGVVNWRGEPILFTAVRCGNDKVAQLLLERGGDVGVMNENGETALFPAARRGYEGVVQLLLKRGADVSVLNKDGETALFPAVRNDHEGVVQLLLKRGADVSVVNKDGETALFPAARRGYEGVVQLLLKRGADVSVLNKDGETALLPAARHGYEGVVQLLLESRADVSVLNKDGETALFPGVRSGNEEVVKLLLQSGADVHVANKDGEAVLFPAVKEGNEKVVQLLLQSGSDPNSRNQDGSKILAFATKLSVLKLLLGSGADITSRNARGESFVHIILASDFFSGSKRELISYFITDAQFCLPKTRDNEGNSTLHSWAAASLSMWPDSHIKFIGQELIDNGAVVNATNDKGQTPLHRATTWDAVELLVANGARPNTQDAQGRTPLLHMYVATLKSVEMGLCWKDVLHIGMDPWVADHNGNTVAEFLLGEEDFEEVSELVEEVKDHQEGGVNKPHTNGDTFLHIACRCESDGVQKLLDQLLLAGAKLNVRNSDRETPLHITCKKVVEVTSSGSEDDALASVHFWAAGRLLKHGADPSIRNGAGESCFDLARGCPGLEELLSQPVDLLQIPASLPWSQQSEQHRDKLAQVSRGQRSEGEGNYQFHAEHIGSGGFGDVYAGINARDGREVAVKCIERRYLCSPKDRREVRNLVKLQDCDQVVKYIDVLENEPQRRVFIVLELMEGNLDDCMDLGPLDASILGKLCEDIVTGLAYLHANDILHRDIKPANILYKKTDRLCLKIADFGLSSKDSVGAPATTTVMRTGAGTRCWMAPEILRASGTPVHAKESDTFACGLVLHYLLADKRHPFAPVDTSGKSPVLVQNETERKIIDGNSSVDVQFCPESRDLVELMIKDSAHERLSSDAVPKHVFFWSKEKRARFICAVGNQPEFGIPYRYPSRVTTDLKRTLGGKFNAASPWNMRIPSIYREMTSSCKGRPYNTSSAVELVRFVRNTYAHISDSARSTTMKTEVLSRYVFVTEFPTLFMDVYRAVKLENWDSARDEIAKVVVD